MSAQTYFRRLMTRALRFRPAVTIRTRPVPLGRRLKALEERTVPAFTMSLAGLTATVIGDGATDTLQISSDAGLLVHNRFAAGDPGFNSAFDFDNVVPGDQTVGANNSSSLVIDVGGGLDAVVLGGTVTTPAPAGSIGAAVTLLNNAFGRLTIDDSLRAAAATYQYDDGVSFAISSTGGVNVTNLAAGPISLLTGSAGDTVNVLSTSAGAPLTLATGAGNDTISVTAANLNAAVSVDGGTQTDQVTVTAGGAGVTVTPTSLTVAGRPAVTLANVETGTVNNAGAVTASGDAGNNTFAAGANGVGGVVAGFAGTTTYALNGVTGLGYNGLAGNDTFVADYTLGSLNFPVAYDGGTQTGTPGDVMRVTGYNVGNLTVTHNTNLAGGVHNGSVTVGGISTINFTNIEPLTLAGTAANLIVNLPAAPNANVLLADDGNANFPTDPDGNTASTSAIGSLEAVPTFEFTQFTNPTNSLTVNLGAAGDTLRVRTLDALFPAIASLAVNGGAGNDSLVMDYSTGAQFKPASGTGTAVQFNAGAGLDTVGFATNNAFPGGPFPNLRMTYSATGNDVGQVVVDPNDSGGPGAPAGPVGADGAFVTFSGAESVETSIPVGSLDLLLTNLADSAVLVNSTTTLGYGGIQTPAGTTADQLSDLGNTFSNVRFVNARNVSVHGLNGTDTLSLNYSTAAAGLLGVTMYGYADPVLVAAVTLPPDDNTADVFGILATPAGVTHNLFGQGGNDDFGNILPVANDYRMDDVAGPVNVVGGAGTNALALSNRSGGGPQTVTVTTGLLTSNRWAPITFSQLESALVGGTVFNDTFDVLSTVAGTRHLLAGDSGNDTFTVGNTTADFNAPVFDGSLANILGIVSILPDFYGFSGTGNADTVNVDASGTASLAGPAAVFNINTVSPYLNSSGGQSLTKEMTLLTGFAPASIFYAFDQVTDTVTGVRDGDMEFANIRASTGADTISVIDTSARNTTTLDTRGGDDVVTIDGDGLSANNVFRGFDGNDQFTLNVTIAVGSAGFFPIQGLLIDGGNNLPGTPGTATNRDRLTINDTNSGASRNLNFQYLPSQGGLDVLGTGAGLMGGAGTDDVNVRGTETVVFNDTSGTNNDFTTLTGTAGDDQITVAQLPGGGVTAFLNGQPYLSSPPSVIALNNPTNRPGVSGGGTGPDLFIGGIGQPFLGGPFGGPVPGLTVDGGGNAGTPSAGDQLIVYAAGEQDLLDQTFATTNLFQTAVLPGTGLSFGPQVLVPGFGAGNAYDVIQVSDSLVATNNNAFGFLTSVSIVTPSFVQNGPSSFGQPGLIVNGNDEAVPQASGLADDIRTFSSGSFAIRTNQNLPLIVTNTSLADLGPNPTTCGELVTFRATVTPAVSTGFVQFFDNAGGGFVFLGSAPVVGGVATFATRALPTGLRSITSQYVNPDPSYQSSTSNTVIQTVDFANATATTSATSPVAYGTTLTLFADVASQVPGPVPDRTGQVRFTISPGGLTVFGTLSNNSTSVSVATLGTLPPGTYTYTATYLGDGCYNPSPPVSGSFVVTPVSAAPSLSSTGGGFCTDPVTFTTTVSPSYAPGSVRFVIDNGAPVTRPVVAGSASYQVSNLTAVQHTITATFISSDPYIPSGTPQTITYTPTATPTATNLAPVASVAYGSPVTLAANVTATVAGPVPNRTGQVTFTITRNGAPPFGTTVTGTLSNNGTSITIPGLPAGTYTFTAAYSGDGCFGTSGGGGSFTVAQAGSGTGVSASPNPATYGDTVRLRATVASNAGSGAAAPTGTVTFRLTPSAGPAQTFGPVNVVGGQATFDAAGVLPGSYTLTATYTGDTNYTGGSGSALGSVQVNPARTTTTVPPPGTALYNTPIPVTATITPLNPGGAAPTGTMTFTVNGTTYAPVAVSGNSVSFTIPAGLNPGTYQGTAAYSGNPCYVGSSGTFTVTVASAASSTTLTSAPASVTLGDAVTLTATVTVPAGGPSPTGQVAFTVDGNTYTAAVTPTGPGTATAAVTVSGLLAGTYPATARYNGDANYTSSTATPDTVTVTQHATTLGVTAAPSPATYGDAVTLTATLAPSGLPAGPLPANPTGSVTFRVNGNVVGTAPLSGGTASISVPGLLASPTGPVTPYTVTADYSGDRNFAAAPTATTTEVVNRAASQVGTTPTPGSTVYGTPVTVTATVASLAGPTATRGPTGTVQFVIDGVTYTAALSGTTASVTAVPAATGAGQSYTATYSGDANFTGSTSTGRYDVTAADTSTAATAAPNPAPLGAPVTLTATVGASAGSAPAAAPGGSVTFRLGSFTSTQPLVGNTASVTVSPNLVAGSYTFTASYSGDARYSASTGSGSAQVTPAATTTTVVTPVNVTFGGTATLQATVAAPGGPFPAVRTGTVTFTIDGRTLTTPLSGGSASVAVPGLTGGTHGFTASYSGDANFTGSSAAGSVVVARATPTLTVPSVPPVVAGNAVTLTATVDGPAGATPPTGLVTFTINGQTYTAQLHSPASVTVTGLPPGTYPYTARYAGDTDYQPAGPVGGSATVTASGTTTAVTASPGTSTYGDPVRLTAVVTGPANTGATVGPSGNVTFAVRGTAVSFTAPVNGTTATADVIPPLPAGTYTVDATYSGDTNFTGSAGSTAMTVGKAPTTTTLTLPQNPVQPGQPLNVSVAVTGAGQPLRPAGPVELLTGARSLGTATLTNGTAAFSIPNTTTFTGVNQLTVRYLGDANFQPSASAATQVLIQEKPIVLVGSDFGPVLCVYDNTITLRHGISDVGAGFTGVRPASGDFDGDGINDYLVGSARNAPSLVAVLDGTSKQQRLTFSPFGADFTGGVFVAAGDIDRDGRADVVASADTGGGPRVRVFLSRGAGLVPVADFFAIDDPNFRGGSRVAVGDVNGDGFADLVATAGPGGGARVAGFDGKSLAQGQTVKMFNDFFAIDDPNFRGGAFVALGDFNGDRNADFVFGAENGGAPIVTVFDSVKLLGGEAKTAQLASFFAGPATDRGGIRVAARDLNFDGKADIITGAGVGSGSAVNAYDGLAVFNGLSGQPTPILSDVAFPGLTGGVYVG